VVSATIFSTAALTVAPASPVPAPVSFSALRAELQVF